MEKQINYRRWEFKGPYGLGEQHSPLSGEYHAAEFVPGEYIVEELTTE